MSKSTSKFSTFEFAVDSQAQINQLQSEIRLLETEQKGLTPNLTLSPLEAARDLVKREDAIAKDLRERRLALTVSDPDTSPLWRQAVSEMRSEVGRLDAELRALVEKASGAASRLLSSIVPQTEFVVGYSRVVLQAEALVSAFNRAFSSAVNSHGAEIAAHATVLHTAIEEIPAKIKEVQSLIAVTEKAANDLQRHFPVTSSEEATA